MGFFKLKHKLLAKKPTSYLQQQYSKSEQNLVRASSTGDEKLIKKAMKEHGNYEYALLYKNTPEFKNKIKNKKRGRL